MCHKYARYNALSTRNAFSRLLCEGNKEASSHTEFTLVTYAWNSLLLLVHDSDHKSPSLEANLQTPE